MAVAVLTLVARVFIMAALQFWTGLSVSAYRFSLSRAITQGGFSLMFSVLLRKTKSAGVRLRRFILSSRFGVSPDSIYGNAFYDGPGFGETERTAELVATYLFKRYNPDTVLDLGCGMGNYLKHFARQGCMTIGFEGSRWGVGKIPEDILGIQYDLRKPLRTNRLFELVLSIEVAEHIPS